ncbi:MAG: acyltransferase family protein [Glaciecola sp.]|nr:acyltransferase family protein [Glaciecola sp.]MDG1815159.1 acyltransferase family protein [Glaciecola sp.]MDG2098671.1 acyltransferase family protein [Glaciecola sp.]
MQFRKDLNGLRAFAVIAVVLFHFNASWMPGGFAGVDVFFVISGFLMTSIIFSGLEHNQFSILSFYVARANRIIPALAALCLVLLIFGWFVLPPLEYRTLGNHIGSSIGFLSNIVYWTESGYFDASSHEKWLLHTWSLSVEWQFYLLYPLILASLAKIVPHKALKTIVLVGTILGFMYGVYATYQAPKAAYFLLSSRAWEMMLGGVAYLYPFKLSDTKQKLCEWLGLTLIIISYFFFSKNSLWPGYLALFPVLGAFLLIQAQRHNSALTGNILMQKIGKWSYSIYLWHWPLVVAIFYFALPTPYIYLGIGLSLLCGFMSYHCIERIRFEQHFSHWSQYARCVPLHLVIAVGLLASSVYITNGVHQRFEVNSQIAQLTHQLIMPFRHNGYCFYSFNDGQTQVDETLGSDCYLGDHSAQAPVTKTLLFGDSYAGHYEPFFDELFSAQNHLVQVISTNWCTPSLTDNYTGPKTHIAYRQCLLNRAYLKQHMQQYNNLIIAGAWDDALYLGQLEDVKQVIASAASMQINVFIMPAPHRYKQNPLSYFYRRFYFNQPFDINELDDNDTLTTAANIRLSEIADQYPNVSFIKRSWLFTNNNTFTINEVAIPYSLDGKHISILGAKQSAKFFMEQTHYPMLMEKFDFN